MLEHLNKNSQPERFPTFAPMHLFYTPDITTNTYTLNGEESKHCVRVLRLNEGDRIQLIDGVGGFYDAEITDNNPKRCSVKIIEHKPQLIIVKNIRICLTIHQGELFAVQDACPHNAESLSKGQVNYLGEIICPWHNYRFLLSTGGARDSSCRDLVTYSLKSDDSGFYIAM